MSKADPFSSELYKKTTIKLFKDFRKSTRISKSSMLNFRKFIHFLGDIFRLFNKINRSIK